MKNKSKLVTFLLSIVPGVGQIYLGVTTRGIVFLTVAICIIFMGLFSAFAIRAMELAAFLFIVIVLLWFISMIDSMILCDRINMTPGGTVENQNFNLPVDQNVIKRQNKKVTAMLLSIMPGAGHLYLGLQRQGIEIMFLFLGLIYLTDWLSFSGFVMFAPIIWFYSMFDVMHKVSEDKEMKDEDIFAILNISQEASFIKNRSKIFGYALILIGAMLIVNKVLIPNLGAYLPYHVINSIKTGIVAAVFIAGGVKLILGNKKSLKSQEEA